MKPAADSKSRCKRAPVVPLEDTLVRLQNTAPREVERVLRAHRALVQSSDAAPVESFQVITEGMLRSPNGRVPRYP